MELCARIDDSLKYGAPFWGGYDSDRLRGKDQGGFACNLPNARFEKWQHNSLGFRGPDLTQEKKPGMARVVCLGSSESYGLYESPGKEWPAQLRALLPDAKYEIINASMVGLNLPSFDAYLKQHVFPLKPDLVVLVVNPLFYVTGLERAAHAKKAPPLQPAQNRQKQAPSLKEKILSNSRIYPKLKQAAKQAVTGNFPDTFKKYETESAQRKILEIEHAALKGRKPLDAVPESYLESYRRDLERTVELIRSQNADVILTSYPALISRDNQSLYSGIFLDNRRFCIELSVMGIADTFDRFNRVTAEVSKEKGTLFVDAHRLLPKSTDYFGDNVHYTDKGASCFAENVSKMLAKKAR